MEMHITGALYLTLLAITVAAIETPTDDDDDTQPVNKDIHPKTLTKRDLQHIDTSALESSMVFRPKVIYRRAALDMRGLAKPKYGLPRSKYGIPKSRRRPLKKYRGNNLKSRYGPKSSTKRPMNANRNRPYQGKAYPNNPNAQYRNKYRQPSFIRQDPAGFAEPPSEYGMDFNFPAYTETPTDSYGAPLKLNAGSHNGYAMGHRDQFLAASFNIGQDYIFDKQYQNTGGTKQRSKDVAFAHSNGLYPFPQKSRVKPLPFVEEHTDDGLLMAHYKQQDIEEKPQPNFFNYKPAYTKNRKPQIFTDLADFANPPYKKEKRVGDLLVGGQYAEPPLRYLVKSHPSSTMFDEEESIPMPKQIDDADMGTLGVSSYVNYKHSNVAFSPQNLNDAFSIVD